MRRRFFATWDKVRDALEAEPCLAAVAMLWVQETQDSGQDLPCVLQGAEQFGHLLEALCED
jgi:hypothetical protein